MRTGYRQVPLESRVVDVYLSTYRLPLSINSIIRCYEKIPFATKGHTSWQGVRRNSKYSTSMLRFQPIICFHFCSVLSKRKIRSQTASYCALHVSSEGVNLRNDLFGHQSVGELVENLTQILNLTYHHFWAAKGKLTSSHHTFLRMFWPLDSTETLRWKQFWLSRIIFVLSQRR